MRGRRGALLRRAGIAQTWVRERLEVCKVKLMRSTERVPRLRVAPFEFKKLRSSLPARELPSHVRTSLGAAVGSRFRQGEQLELILEMPEEIEHYQQVEGFPRPCDRKSW